VLRYVGMPICILESTVPKFLDDVTKNDGESKIVLLIRHLADSTLVVVSASHIRYMVAFPL